MTNPTTIQIQQNADGSYDLPAITLLPYVAPVPPPSPPPPPVSPPPPPVSPPPPPSGTGGSPGFKYATGYANFAPNYTAQPAPPAPLASFVDPDTGAMIERLTDASKFGTQGAAFPSLKIMYCQFAPDSYDGKYVLVEDPDGYTYVADATTGALVCKTGATENCAPRWDYSGNAPHTLYYVNIWNNTFCAVDGSTGVKTVLHDFTADLAAYPGAVSVFSDGHSDSDGQSRYFPVQFLGNAGDGSWFAVALTIYDRVQNKIVAAITPADVPAGTDDMKLSPPHPLGDIHSAPFSLSRDGKYVAVQWSAPSSSYNANLIDTTRDGSHCYPLTFDASGNVTGIDIANGKRCNPNGAHMTWAYGADGKCYYVSQNPATDWLEAVDPAIGIGPRATDTTQTLSIKIMNMDDPAVGGWPSGNIHFTAPYRAPFGYVGILFDSKDDSVPCANQTFVYAIAAGATPLRIAPSWHTNPGTGGSGDNYDDQHYGAFSQDGSKFYWASNWRNDAGQRDVFVIDLPQGWQSRA